MGNTDKTPNPNLDITKINITQQNLKPIPHEIVPYFEDFLNAKGITDSYIKDLINDKTYPFSALDELFRRENLSYLEFISFVKSSHPEKQDNIAAFLNLNGIDLGYLEQAEKKEITLRDVIVSQYNNKLSSLLLFYIKVLLSNINDDPDSVIDAPAQESTSQLLAIVQALKEKTHNVEQLKTLDLIEAAIDNYHLNLQTDTQTNQSNVLTSEERLDVLPSLSDTRNIYTEAEDVTSASIMQLIDNGSRDRIPKYEFRIGQKLLPKRSQQKMDYVMDILQAIDTSKNRTDYSRWMPAFFDTGGGVVGEIVSEGVRHDILQASLQNIFATSLTQYTTLDARPDLATYLASVLSKDIASKSYETKGIFKNFGELLGAVFTIFGEKREKSEFETYVINKTKETAKEAMDKGFYDDNGNFHQPLNVDDPTKDFIASSAATAGMEGLNNGIPGLSQVPTGVADSVGINPLGDFYPNSLGSTFFPNPEKGLENAPFQFNPSPASRVGDLLEGKVPENVSSALQSQIFNQPELFKNNRFDGSYADIPQVKNVLNQGNLPDFKMAEVKDAVNSAFIQNNFDNAQGFLPKLGVAGNELLGNINKRLDLPFNNDYSALANFLPLAAAPFTKPIDALSGGGGFLLPQKNLEQMFGPSALASKGIDLPTSYDPNVLSQLMANEAPFVGPIDQAMPQGQPRFTPEQMEQYKKYQQAQQNGTYGQQRPKQQPRRNASKNAQEGGENAQKGAKDAPISGAIAGSFVGILAGAPGAATVGFALSGIPLTQWIVGTVLGTNHKSKFGEFIDAIGEYSGLTGTTKPGSIFIDAQGNQILKFNESQRFSDRLWNKSFGRVFGKVYDSIGGFTINIEDTTLADTQALFNQRMQKLINGNKTGRNTRKTRQNQIPKIIQDQIYNSIYKSVLKSNLSKISSLYGLANAANSSSMGEIFESILESQVEEHDISKKLEYDYHAQVAAQLRRNYFRFLKGQFSNARYLESIGIDPTVTGVQRNADGSLARDKENNLILTTNGKTLYSQSIRGRVMKIRGGFGSIYNGFLGLSQPLRRDMGMIGLFNYFLSTVPQSAINFTKGIQSLYGAFTTIKFQKWIADFTFGNETRPNVLQLVENGRFVFERIKNKQGKYVWEQTIRVIKTGHRTGFGRIFDWFFKQDTKIRSGIWKVLLGESKSFYKNTATRGYFGFLKYANDFYSAATNPASFIQRKIVGYLQGLAWRIAKEFAKLSFKLFTKIVSKIASGIFANTLRAGAAAIVTSLGLGCIIFAVLLIIIVIAISGIAGSTKSAYGPSINGLTAGGAGLGGPLACTPEKKDKAYRNGVEVDAHVLPVPYFNQVVLDPAAKNDPEKQAANTPGKKEDRYTSSNRIRGGGNMCGAASSVMVIGYFNQFSLIPNQSATALQDYMYMDKGQLANNFSNAGACLSIDGNGSQDVKGGFFNTSNGNCLLTDWGAMGRYLARYGLKMEPVGTDISDNQRNRGTNNLYSAIQKSIDIDGNPLIMSLSQGEFGHLLVIVGYTTDSNGVVNGAVTNDPYTNLQYSLEKNKTLYTGYFGGLDPTKEPQSGYRAVYDLSIMPIRAVWAIKPVDESKISKKGNAVCSPGNVDTKDDKIVTTVWQHSQNYNLSCEIGSLATSLNTAGIDLGKGSVDQGNKIREIENKIIADYVPKDKRTAPVVSNGKITQWDDPSVQFVGEIDGRGLSFTDNTSVQGYGTHAEYIDKIAKQYGATTKFLKGNVNSIKELYNGVDNGQSSVVWVPTEFEGMSDPSKLSGTAKTTVENQIKLLDANVANGYKDYEWKTPEGKTVQYIPHEHAVVFYGYNPSKKLVYLMDVYKNRALPDKLAGTDSPKITTQKVTMTEEQFIKMWSYLNYQAVVVGSKNSSTNNKPSQI